MKKIKDFIRPAYYKLVHPHIKNVCRKTEHDFKSFKNKYKGNRCFIVANGPSLLMRDLDLLWERKEFTFGMNRIYALYDRTQWRPSFYLAQDPTVIRSCHDEIENMTKESVVFVKVPGEPKYDFEKAINFDLDYRNVRKNIAPDFYNGENFIFADGKSVMYTALQLAVYMGFQTIYLLGADCSYSNDNKKISKNSYPDERMFDSKKIGMPPDIEYTFTAYKSAKKYAQNHNIKIINATRGGMLELFERVDFDMIMRYDNEFEKNNFR